MRQFVAVHPTLFHIPSRIGGFPLFGWGVLLALWAVTGMLALVRAGRRDGIHQAVVALGPPLALAGAMILWLLPALDDGQGVPVRGYGMMLLVAAAAGVWLAIIRGRSAGYDADTILSLGLGVFLWGIVGARLFHVIEYHDQFFPPGRSLILGIPGVLNVAAGGLTVFGSLPTAALAAWHFAWRRGLSLPRLADCIAPSLLLGLAIGRVGCFLNGCCFGGPCDLPWALQFPPHSPPWIDQAMHGLLGEMPATAPLPKSLPIQPTQLYAALDAALLAALAVAFTPSSRRDGAVFALVLTLHPISRFLLEMIRVDEPPALGSPLSISQLVALVLLALAGGLWWWLWHQPLRHPWDGTPDGPSAVGPLSTGSEGLL